MDEELESAGEENTTSSELHISKEVQAQGGCRKLCSGLALQECGKLFCQLAFSRNFPVDLYFRMPVRKNLARYLPHVSAEDYLGKGRVCFEQGPITFQQISLAQPLSELNLLVNLSGIHFQQHHLFMIVLPSDHLPSINSPLCVPLL